MATMKRRHIPLSEKQRDYSDEYNDTDSYKQKNHKYQVQPQQAVSYSSNPVRETNPFVSAFFLRMLLITLEFSVEYRLLTKKSAYYHYHFINSFIFLDKIQKDHS